MVCFVGSSKSFIPYQHIRRTFLETHHGNHGELNLGTDQLGNQIIIFLAFLFMFTNSLALNLGYCLSHPDTSQRTVSGHAALFMMFIESLDVAT